MASANRAPLEDEFLDGDDPFMDAADIERLMLGEATHEDIQVAQQQQMNQPQASAPGGARFGAAHAPVMDEADDDFAYEAEDGFDEDMEFEEPADLGGLDPMFDAAVDEFDSEDLIMPAGEALYGEVDGDVPDQPVPRITIAAFCERPETGTLVHKAADDRRLAKAHVQVELGGLPAAIERYHDETTPNLLIVETGMRGSGLFDQLEHLAGVCDPDTKVVIVGAANDISLYRELMKRGVSEYLVPPMTPLHLIRTISDLFLDPDQPFAGKTIAFVGAKGGVGSSTIAHNACWALTEGMHADAVLVDMDLSFGTAGLDFNQDPAQTLGDALTEPDRLDDALLDRLLVRCTDRLSLFSAPAYAGQGLGVPAARIRNGARKGPSSGAVHCTGPAACLVALGQADPAESPTRWWSRLRRILPPCAMPRTCSIS